MMGTNIKENTLFKEILKYQFLYWKNHTQAVDYIMFDYFINYIYKNNNYCKKIIDEVKNNNENVFELFPILNENINENNINKYNSIKKNTEIFKLNWKKEIKNTCDSMWNYVLRSIEE